MITRLIDVTVQKDSANLEILCNLTHKTLKRELTDEELRGLLVATDFTQGNRTGAEAVRFFDPSCRDLSQASVRRNEKGEQPTYSSGLPSCLGGELFTGGFACPTRLRCQS